MTAARVSLDSHVDVKHVYSFSVKQEKANFEIRYNLIFEKRCFVSIF